MRLRRSPDLRDKKEERAKSCCSRTTPQAASLKTPITPSSSGCSRRCVCCKIWACSRAQAAIHCYSVTKKTQTFSEREQNSSSISPESHVPLQRPVTRTNPTPGFSGRRMASHPEVSEWVLGIIKRGYSLQFARRPPRFSPHFGSEQRCTRPALRSEKSAGKGSCGDGYSSSE